MGALVTTLRRNPPPPPSFHVSPSSRFFITGSRDMTARIYSTNPIEGYQPLTLTGHRNYVVGVFFSSDAEKVLSGVCLLDRVCACVCVHALLSVCVCVCVCLCMCVRALVRVRIPDLHTDGRISTDPPSLAP